MMEVTERESGDAEELRRHAAYERDAARRDRYRAVLLALGGETADDIAAAVGRSRRGVQAWVYAYRDGGIDVARPKPTSGRPRSSRQSTSGCTCTRTSASST